MLRPAFFLYRGFEDKEKACLIYFGLIAVFSKAQL